MLPYFTFFGEKIYLFPLILSFAFMVCIGVFMIRRVYNKSGYKSYIKILIFVMFFSLLGGKTLSVLSLLSQRKGTILDCLIISGNIFYGCLIGGCITLFICSKHYRLNCFDLSDVCASILPLGQSIGRIGCFMNGCCYGKPYECVLSISYPVQGKIISVFPTWFIESAFCLILFFALQILVGKIYRGLITSIYLMSYSVYRFIIEFFRGDNLRGTIFIFSTSQFISLIIFLCAIILLWYSATKKHKNNLFLEV